MFDYSLRDIRKVNEAYEMMINEAQARPNSYKNLTPEQAEEFAKLSPSYISPQIWGNTSNWICSIANRLIKFRKLTPEQAYEYAKATKPYIDGFEKHSGKFKKDIGTIQSYDDLKQFMDDATKNGMTFGGLTQKAKLDGRARQCYSLMKNGGENFVQTYEDSNYLIGYPTNYAYNSKFSSIGKWCHTGSFENGEKYWGDYAQFPIFYILNKNDGSVLCASYQNGHGEVRDQRDLYPIGFTNSNWDEFFTSIGLKKPMVQDIDSVTSNYEVPEDAIIDVWERVDVGLVEANLFNYLESSLEESDYVRGNGNFYLNATIDIIDPNKSSDDETALHTRYKSDVDENEYYTFEEFKVLSHETWNINSTDYHNAYIEKLIVNSNLFQNLWSTAYDMDYNGRWSNFSLHDEYTMADRFSTDDLLRMLNGEQVNFGFDSRRKQVEIVDKFRNILVKEFCRLFFNNRRDSIPEKYGSIDMWDDRIDISIDADEANGLANRIERDEIHFEKGPDIIACNLGGKNSFAVKRVNISKDLAESISNSILYIKYICKTPMDLEGQQTLELRDSNGYRV